MSNALEVSGKNDGLVFRKQTDPAAWRSASPADLVRSGYTIGRPVIADGTLEALKWLALLLMTGDHIDKYLFNGTLPWLFNASRVTLPLFVFVLAYNLARPDTIEHGAYPRTMKRLALFGVLATPVFIALGGLMAGWWPLNIMFALLGLAAMLYLIERRTVSGYATAVAVFLLVGSSVEFWWPALALGVAVWWYCKQPDWKPVALALAALAALWFVNSNLWALAAVPVLLMACRLDLHLPRPRWLFYAYYPLHLAALWLLRIPMSKAGYLFLSEGNRTRLCHGNYQPKSGDITRNKFALYQNIFPGDKHANHNQSPHQCMDSCRTLLRLRLCGGNRQHARTTNRQRHRHGRWELYYHGSRRRRHDHALPCQRQERANVQLLRYRNSQLPGPPSVRGAMQSTGSQ